MHFQNTFDISFSGMSVQRKRMDIISHNLANIETTRTEEGTPYRRKMLVMSPDEKEMTFSDTLTGALSGVKIDEVVEDPTPFKEEFVPGHPDADERGYVRKPNVDLFVENVNMLTAKRAFESNVAAVKTAREMAMAALEIGR
jgi:flagellar basal-body rod protein FlgC